MSKDTITVEFPIEAHDDCYVSVTGVISVSREYWRKIAANPNITLNDTVSTIAPAVVEWIERDEWEPLDVPEVGRTIKATLRDGREETFEVEALGGGSPWTAVYPSHVSPARYIERDRDEGTHEPDDIIAWEYVDEPAQPAISAEQVEAIIRIVMDTECEHSGSCEVGWGDRCSSPENGWQLRWKIARRIRAAGLLTEGEGESGA